MQNKKVTIIGGGASGIIAAISCKKHNPNYDVVLLEKNFKLGRKILATGNGRCNITNKNIDIKNYHTSSKSKDLIKNIFNEFGYDNFLELIDDLGIITKEENRGRIFPKTNQALTVVKAFEEELKNLGIKIEYNTEIKKYRK
jgi:predicted Rossmann fold flavoprotein